VSYVQWHDVWSTQMVISNRLLFHVSALLRRRYMADRHFKQLYKREIVLFAHAGSDSVKSIHGTEGFSISKQR
jgi:hypothetical protein